VGQTLRIPPKHFKIPQAHNEKIQNNNVPDDHAQHSFWGEGNAGVFFGDISESDDEEEEDEEGEEDDEEESDDDDDEDDDDESDDGVGSQFGDRDAFPVEDEDDLRLPGHM
jgi:hypothetical protein